MRALHSVGCRLADERNHVVYGGLQLHAAEVMDRGTSDHQPVVVVLGAIDSVAVP